MSAPRVMLDALVNRSRTQIVRVRVVDKQPRQESSTKCSYQRMVLLDEMDNRMTCTLFGVDISIYENIIERGKWYDLKHPVVKPVPSRFATYVGEKQLYFTNSTEVFFVEDAPSSSQPPIFYVPIHDLPRDATKDDRFDVVVILLWVYLEKIVAKGDTSLPVREISVTDDSCDQVLLIAAWNRVLMTEFEKLENLLDDDPIVEISGLKVSSFSGFSLVGSMSTVVKTHPISERAESLRQWYRANKLTADFRVVLSITNEMPGFPTEVTTIAASLSLRVSDIIEAQVIRVKAHIPEIQYEKIKISFGCRACGKTCTDDSIQFEQSYHCVTCGVVKKAEPKMYMRFKCTDGTGTLTLDAYTRNLERLFQTNSRDFFTMTLPDRRRVVDRAHIRFCIGMAEFLISPVKSLFVNHDTIKWFLKEIVV